LTREHVLYFVHQHYLPDRITVAGAGNVEHDQFVAQVRDAFWRMLGHSEPAAGLSPEYHAGVILEHNPFAQAYFSMGIRACPYAHPDRYALHLLNGILGGGTSSRLFRRLREEQGLVYFIGSNYHAYQDDGLLVIEGSTTPKHLMQVLELTLLEIWKLIKAEEPVTEEELWKAKMQIRGQHLIAAENTNTRMGRLATQEFYFGRRITTEEVLSNIESVEERLLQGQAKDVFEDPGRHLALAVVGPDTPESYSQASIEELGFGFH
jgi:predicted Zn-dependent peptidase